MVVGIFFIAHAQPPSGGCVLKQFSPRGLANFQAQPPSGGCVLKHGLFCLRFGLFGPAAFGRLCVETVRVIFLLLESCQPPSGGCVLKLCKVGFCITIFCQPPSGGCVLKLILARAFIHMRFQPPSDGCVLKRRRLVCDWRGDLPAAFGRLCVETGSEFKPETTMDPAAFGRLCVETLSSTRCRIVRQPAAFGRLCVETGLKQMIDFQNIQPPSGGCVLKLDEADYLVGKNGPAAFGRLCVETDWVWDCWVWLRPAAFGRLCVETI